MTNFLLKAKVKNTSNPLLIPNPHKLLCTKKVGNNSLNYELKAVQFCQKIYKLTKILCAFRGSRVISVKLYYLLNASAFQMGHHHLSMNVTIGNIRVERKSKEFK